MTDFELRLDYAIFLIFYSMGLTIHPDRLSELRYIFMEALVNTPLDQIKQTGTVSLDLENMKPQGEA